MADPMIQAGPVVDPDVVSNAEAGPLPAVPRPRILTALAILWLSGVVLFPALGLRAYAEYGVLPPGSLPLTAISALMSYSLWTARPWARVLQMILLVPMSCVPPYAFAAILLLGYMNRPETRRYFVPGRAGRSWNDAVGWSGSEWPWVAGILAALVMGVCLLLAMAPLFRVWR